MENQLVVFELDGEQFGVNIVDVESIIKMQSITKMPNAPRFVEGVTNLRGNVLPVIDLRKRLNMISRVNEKDGRIIVVNLMGTGVGIIVDGVAEILRISDEDIEEAPSITSTIDSTFIIGIAKMEQRLIIVLDLKRVLSIDEHTQLFELSAAA